MNKDSHFDITYEGPTYSLLYGHDLHASTLTNKKTGLVVEFSYIVKHDYNSSTPARYELQNLDQVKVASLSDSNISEELADSLNKVSEEVERLKAKDELSRLSQSDLIYS